MGIRLKTCTLRVLLLGCISVTCLLFIFMHLSDNLIFVQESTSNNYDFNAVGNISLPKIIKIGEDSANLNKVARKKQFLGACKIPMLIMDQPEVMQFYKKVEPLNCEKNNPPSWLYLDEDARIQPTKFVVDNFNLEQISCQWQFFKRKTDNKLQWFKPELVPMGSRAGKSDFFIAKCVYNGETEKQKSWKGLFMTPIATPEKLEELKAAKANLPRDWSGLNVYVLGFDSLSQMSFRRNLPLTVEYLEKVMGSVTLNGLNIVGDGTPQAYIPFLTGQTEEELPLTRKRYENANFVDEVYPFIWNNFSDAGYATLYGEDAYAIGTFTYRLKGFLKQPTDHFLSTFFNQYEQLYRYSNCAGDVPQHQIWFEYAERFWKVYRDYPRFLLLHHSALSHDDINRVQVADNDMRDHLKRLFESGAFNNTLFILMADHGHRFSKLRDTQQGQLEERLPFYSVFLPPSLRTDPRFRTAYENLLINSKDRLISHFDMHSVLENVLHWPQEDELKMVHDPLSEGRSLSIFREIPLSRTCDQAGIEAHWCTCLSWQSTINDTVLREKSILLAKTVVQVMNDETENERKLCAPLALDSLVDAKRLTPNEDLMKYSGVKDKDGFVPVLKGNAKTVSATYQLVLTTKPGKAKYEVTILYDELSDTVTVDLGAISHINAYGDDPHCIISKNYFLATYCVCYDRI